MTWPRSAPLDLRAMERHAAIVISGLARSALEELVGELQRGEMALLAALRDTRAGLREIADAQPKLASPNAASGSYGQDETWFDCALRMKRAAAVLASATDD